MNRNKETKQDKNKAYHFLHLNSKATLIIGENAIFLYLQPGQVKL